MRYFAPALALLVGSPALAQTTAPQTAAPTPTDQMTQSAQTTGDPTTAPAPGAASQAPAALVKPKVGATVYGSGGTPVGTIKAMDAQFVTLATDKGEVRLPIASVGAGPTGPVVGVTAEQLSAAIDQAKAAQPVATSKTTSAATSDAAGTTTTAKTRTRKRR